MKIKELPEDFIVKEVLELKVEDGSYYYYFVTKKNWNTLDVVKEISQRLHVKDVGYAGLKDRIAVTSQYISVQKKINFTLKDVKFEYLGTGKQRIFLGSLKGNAFILTLRDLEKKIAPVKEIINYFGALKKSGKERLKFYLHAYQSELWNTLAEKSKKKIIPIIGYLTEGKEYDTILKEKGISKEDFILRSIPEIGVEGGERNRVVQVENFKTLSFEDDELHPGKKKQVISFYLEKGAYATTVLEALDI